MRRLKHRSGWLIGAGFLAIAIAGDNPRPSSRPVEPALPADSRTQEEPSSRMSFDLEGEVPSLPDFDPDRVMPELPPEEPDFQFDADTPEFLHKIEARMAEVAKEIAPVSFEIPDDPPPHEGKMIDIPVIIDAPDILQVEVLEALPGRPITGERLVRPDGTISLEFYGNVHVRGLTPEQAKTRIILQLRKHLTDEVLGLIDDEAVFDEESAQGTDIPAEVSPKPIPLPPVGGEASDLQPDEDAIDLDKLTPEQREAIRELLRLRSQKKIRPSGFPARAPRRTVRQVARQVPTNPHPSPVIVVPTERGKVKVTIEVEGNVKGPASSSTPLPEQDDDPWGVGMTRIRHPRDSDRVFVDLAAYNHTVYYVQGDAASPGRLPITGNETVLDALNYAGGLAPTADPANIKLIRPGHGGKPSRIYHINYKAIMEEGDAKSNLQIFPGDRLVIGRHPTVQATVALDRVTAFVNSATNTILTDSYMAKNLRTGTQEAPLTPEQIRERVDAWLDVMWPLIEKGEAGVVDKETFREALLKPVAPETKTKGESKDD